MEVETDRGARNGEPIDQHLFDEGVGLQSCKCVIKLDHDGAVERGGSEQAQLGGPIGQAKQGLIRPEERTRMGLKGQVPLPGAKERARTPSKFPMATMAPRSSPARCGACIGAVCDPADFTKVVEVATGVLTGFEGQVVVDLVEPGCEPLEWLGELVEEKVFQDVTPWVVIRIFRPQLPKSSETPHNEARAP